MTKYEVEMDDAMLEKVQSGFPDLKLVKIEETSAEGKAEAPEETKKPGE